MVRKIHAVVLASGVLLTGAAAWAQEPTPAEFLATVLRQDQLLAAGVTGPILDHPWVTDADKDLVRKALKPMDDALAAMKKNAAAADATTGAIMVDQQNVVEASKDVMVLLQTRGDLYWIQLRAKGVQQFMAQMMQSSPADLADLIKATGTDDAQRAKATAILEAFKADFAALQKPAAAPADRAQQMALATALSERTLSALKALNGQLLPAQRFDLEWALTKAIREDGDEKAFFILGFASQPGMMKAPEAGIYLLMTTGGDMKAEPKQFASVTLKKGDPIGFKKADKGTTASAGDQNFDAAAANVTGIFWQLSASKP